MEYTKRDWPKKKRDLRTVKDTKMHRIKHHILNTEPYLATKPQIRNKRDLRTVKDTEIHRMEKYFLNTEPYLATSPRICNKRDLHTIQPLSHMDELN